MARCSLSVPLPHTLASACGPSSPWLPQTPSCPSHPWFLSRGCFVASDCARLELGALEGMASGGLSPGGRGGHGSLGGRSPGGRLLEGRAGSASRLLLSCVGGSLTDRGSEREVALPTSPGPKARSTRRPLSPQPAPRARTRARTPPAARNEGQVPGPGGPEPLLGKGHPELRAPPALPGRPPLTVPTPGGDAPGCKAASHPLTPGPSHGRRVILVTWGLPTAVLGSFPGSFPWAQASVRSGELGGGAVRVPATPGTAGPVRPPSVGVPVEFGGSRAAVGRAGHWARPTLSATGATLSLERIGHVSDMHVAWPGARSQRPSVGNKSSPSGPPGGWCVAKSSGPLRTGVLRL